MLIWGTWTFYPFFYNIQAFYLLEIGPPKNFPIWINVLIFIEFILGYGLFRTANLQKHNFKFDSKTIIWGKQAEYIATPDNKKKTVSFRLVGTFKTP